MPLTLEQKKKFFKLNGFPEEEAFNNDVMDDGSVVPIKQQVPTPTVEEPKMSKLEAIGTRLKAQALPLAGSILGSAALGAVTGGYSIPVQIGAKVLGMLGGGALTDIGQKKFGVIDEAEQQKAIQDQYLASLATDLAPSIALGRFNPSNVKSAYQTATALPNAIRTARATRNLPGVKPGFLSYQQLAAGQITREGLENLASVGVGAGFPLTTQVISPLARGEDVDWTYAIPNIAAGALFNEPRNIANPMYRRPLPKTLQAEVVPTTVEEPTLGPTGRQAAVYSKNIPEIDPLTGSKLKPLEEIRKTIAEEDLLMKQNAIDPATVPVNERPLIVQKLKENLPPVKTTLPVPGGRTEEQAYDVVQQRVNEINKRKLEEENRRKRIEDFEAAKTTMSIPKGISEEQAAKIVEQRQNAIANRYVNEQITKANKKDFELALQEQEYANQQRALGQEQLSFEKQAAEADAVVQARLARIKNEQEAKKLAEDFAIAEAEKAKLVKGAKEIPQEELVKERQQMWEGKKQQLMSEGTGRMEEVPRSKEEIDAINFARTRGVTVEEAKQILGEGVNAKLEYAPPQEYSKATLGIGSKQPENISILHEVVHKSLQGLREAKNPRILEFDRRIVQSPEFQSMRKLYEDAGQTDFTVDEYIARTLQDPVAKERSAFISGESKYGIKRMFKDLLNEAKLLTKTAKDKDYLDYIESIVSQKRDFQAEFGKEEPISLKTTVGETQENKPKEVFSKSVSGETPSTVKLGIEEESKTLGQKIADVLAKTKGQIEQIGDKNLQNAFSEVQAYKNEVLGRFRNKSTEIIEGLKPDQRDLLYRVLVAERNGRKTFANELGGNTYKAYIKLRELLAEKQDYQNELGILVDGRQAKKDPFYIPMMASKKAIDFLTSANDTPQKRQLENDFIQHQMKRLGVSKESATMMLEDYKKSFGVEVPGSNIDFGAVRRAEGIGLPDSWLEKDLGRLLDRYWNRVALDFSWWKNVESNPEVNSKVIAASGDETVRPVINALKGTRASYHPNIEAWGRLSNSLVTSGPKSGIRDLVNAVFNTPRLAPDLQTIIEAGYSALTNWDKSKMESFKNGFNRKSLSDFQEYVQTGGKFDETLNKISNGLSKISTRQKLEEISRTFVQGAMDVIVAKHKAIANGEIPGDRRYSKWILDKMANGRDWNKIDTDVLASRMGETVQGTYDPRNLPAWMTDSDFAPLFKLARWSVDQWNQTRKFVIEPALKAVGVNAKSLEDVPPSLKPLAITIGMSGAIGGMVTQLVTSMMAGKEGREPSWKEIQASEGPESEKNKARAYKIAALMSASGTLGIMGDTLRIPFDIMYGNNPRLLRNALQEPIAVIAEKMGDGLKAYSENPDEGLDILGNVLLDIARLNMQLFRTFYDFALKDEKQKFDEEAYRDIKTFRSLEGRGQSKPPEFNPYMNLKQKEFKKTSSLDRAKELLPSLKQGIIEESRGDREFVRRKMQGLKQNSYQIYPSTPMEARRYKSFLQSTEGEEEADRRLEEFRKQSRVNRLKSQLVR